ncbi:MAG: CCA tRNA nucleotidyltransferase [Candidatus Margulisiibacteriota bacterium]
MKIADGATQIIQKLAQNGHAAYLVGGCVRDDLLGIAPHEWDITTSAPPEEVGKLFKKVLPTGIEFGTVSILMDDGQYEVTTFRSDEKYIDGRHPTKVVFTKDLHMDLARRDFTINALAYDINTEKIIDDFNGIADLKAKIIRCVGDPVERFSEDGLRSVRACRFAAKLNFQIEPSTLEAIPKTLAILKKVAPERIHDEIIKILAAEKPSIGFELMRKTGILKIFIPELDGCFGIEQPPEYHKYDVYWHSLYACDATPQGDYRLRLAALLHDIAKPHCKVDFTFYNHDQAGVELAGKILKRLKFSNADIDYIVNLVRNHMFEYTSEWKDAAVRRFIRRIGGIQNIGPLFSLREADAKAMKQDLGCRYLVDLQKRIDKIIADQNALHVSALKVDGNDIMETLKIKPGPKIGEILNALLEKVLDDPSLNERENLLAMIKNYGQ